MKEAIKNILDISDKTYYNWKNQNRPIILLLELCFTKNELNNFIKNSTKPYKIQLADKYFSRFTKELIKFIFSKSAKALFTAAFKIKDEFHPNKNMNDYVLEEYNEGNINSNDFLNYMNNIPNADLFFYIYENINNNWLFFKESLKLDNIEWMLVYFDILEISILQNRFDYVFGGNDIFDMLVPNPPKLFIDYANKKEIEEKYLNILLEVRKAMSEETLDKLPRYDYFDEEFNLNTKENQI